MRGKDVDRLGGGMFLTEFGALPSDLSSVSQIELVLFDFQIFSFLTWKYNLFIIWLVLLKGCEWGCWVDAIMGLLVIQGFQWSDNHQWRSPSHLWQWQQHPFPNQSQSPHTTLRHLYWVLFPLSHVFLDSFNIFVIEGFQLPLPLILPLPPSLWASPHHPPLLLWLRCMWEIGWAPPSPPPPPPSFSTVRSWLRMGLWRWLWTPLRKGRKFNFKSTLVNLKMEIVDVRNKETDNEPKLCYLSINMMPSSLSLQDKNRWWKWSFIEIYGQQKS